MNRKGIFSSCYKPNHKTKALPAYSLRFIAVSSTLLCPLKKMYNILIHLKTSLFVQDLMTHARIQTRRNMSISPFLQMTDRLCQLCAAAQTRIRCPGYKQDRKFMISHSPAHSAVGLPHQPQQRLISVECKCKIAKWIFIVCLHHFPVRTDPRMDQVLCTERAVKHIRKNAVCQSASAVRILCCLQHPDQCRSQRCHRILARAATYDQTV